MLAELLAGLEVVAAHSALRQGVPQVRICAGAADGVLERILAGDEVGTRLAAEEAATIRTERAVMMSPL